MVNPMRKPAVGIFCEDKYFSEKSFSFFILKLCYAYGADVVAFTEKELNKEENTILARYWTQDGIKTETTLMPHWVECGPSKGWRPYFRDVAKVADDCTLTKKDISNKMINSKFASYVIPTIHTKLPSQVFTLLTMWPSVILKPLTGARGEGILCLEKSSEDKYTFSNTENTIGTYDKKGCTEMLEKIINNSLMIVQPRLRFTNQKGQTMDFRINSTKGTDGKWETIYMIARTARDSIVSNLSQGGYASLVKPTLEAEFGEKAEKILETFDFFAKEIPLYIEEISESNVLSLGIDIGIDYDTFNPYIIEVNYVPQVTFRGKARYADAVARYYAYLTKQIQTD